MPVRIAIACFLTVSLLSLPTHAVAGDFEFRLIVLEETPPENIDRILQYSFSKAGIAFAVKWLSVWAVAIALGGAVILRGRARTG